MVGILVHGDNHFIVRGRLPRVCKAGLMVVISSVPPMLLQCFVCPSNALRSSRTWQFLAHGGRWTAFREPTATGPRHGRYLNQPK
jgi:hypothetical protein